MSLIDKYLPDSQFAERHGIPVFAPAEKLMAAVVAYDPASDPLIRGLIGLREIPARIAGALLGKAILPRQPFGLRNFLLLERDGDREIAFGLLGRFWRLDFGLRAPESAAAFAAFDQPRVAKLVLSFTAERSQDGAMMLRTETRVHCPDRFSKARFTPYWFAIRPASGFIRRRLLTSIKRSAEEAARAGVFEKYIEGRSI